MKTPTDEQIQRLPLWAREHFERLENSRVNAENRLKEYMDSKTPSAIWTSRGYPEEKLFIQDDRIVFQLKLGKVSVRIVRDGLELMGVYAGPEFFVQPQSSNVVHVRIINDRYEQSDK